MSYSLARKEFECKTCVPNRTFRMLVGAEVLEVTCDNCDTKAKIKVKPPAEELKIEEQKTQASSNDWSSSKASTMKSRQGKRLIINAKDIIRPEEQKERQNTRPDSASRQSNFADGAYRMVFTDKKQ